MGMGPLMSESPEPAQIPDFRLAASTGQTLALDSFKGKVPLVVVFVDLNSDEDDDLLRELSSHHKDFGNERSQILAVARATAREVRQASEDMGLSIPILADASGAMARDFVAEVDGKTKRVAVVADREGELIRRFDPLPDGDPTGVIEALLYAVRAIGTGTLGGMTDG